MRAAAPRILLVALALAAGAWLLPALEAVRDQAAGERIVERAGRNLTPADARRAEALLATAAAHTRSSTPELRIAQLRLFDGRPAAAAQVARGLVRDEPANPEAWALLAQALGRSDPPGAAAALAHLRALSPRVAPIAPKN